MSFGLRLTFTLIHSCQYPCFICSRGSSHCLSSCGYHLILDFCFWHVVVIIFSFFHSSFVAFNFWQDIFIQGVLPFYISCCLLLCLLLESYARKFQGSSLFGKYSEALWAENIFYAFVLYDIFNTVSNASDKNLGQSW